MSEPACKLMVDKAWCNKTSFKFMTEKKKAWICNRKQRSKTELTNAREDFLYYYLKSCWYILCSSWNINLVRLIKQYRNKRKYYFSYWTLCLENYLKHLKPQLRDPRSERQYQAQTVALNKCYKFNIFPLLWELH